MALSITIAVLSCATLMGVILIKPSVQIKGKSFDIYWIIPLATAIIVLCLRQVGFIDLKNAFLSSDATNPIKILVLFFAMSLISIYLDETGFFEYLAGVTVKKAKSSQIKLFVIFYVMVSVLTVFTSNDIVILTFTPFICKFCKAGKIDATPYIVSEFVGANTWSMLFVIGNPTNIYLCSSVGIEFLEYFLVMALPTFLAGTVSFLVLFLIFRKSLNVPISCNESECELKEKALAIIGLVHLALCTITLSVSNFLRVEMWIISVGFVVSLFVFVLVYRLCKKQKPTILFKSVKRLPFSLAPTVIGMFVVVLAFKNNGTTTFISNFFGESFIALKYGVSSTLFSNVMNNIPMSVFFSQILQPLSGQILKKAVYSTVIGSNLGALLSPMGALAGIMFTSVLARHGEKFGFLDFIKYGFFITAVSLSFAILGLEIVL